MNVKHSLPYIALHNHVTLNRLHLHLAGVNLRHVIMVIYKWRVQIYRTFARLQMQSDLHWAPASYKEIGNKAGYDTAPNKNKKFGTNFEFLVKKVNSIIIEIWQVKIKFWWKILDKVEDICVHFFTDSHDSIIYLATVHFIIPEFVIHKFKHFHFYKSIHINNGSYILK